MGLINKIVTLGAVAVLAAVTFALPGTASAASAKSAKKKPAATSKQVRAKRVARVVPEDEGRSYSRALPAQPDEVFHPYEQRLGIVRLIDHINIRVPVGALSDHARGQRLGRSGGKPRVVVFRPLHRRTHGVSTR